MMELARSTLKSEVPTSNDTRAVSEGEAAMHPNVTSTQTANARACSNVPQPQIEEARAYECEHGLQRSQS